MISVRFYAYAIWRIALEFIFLLLCLRFQFAALKSVEPNLFIIVLIGGGALALCNPQAGLFAFTAAVPLLNGLGITALVHCSFLCSLFFSSFWVGTLTCRIFDSLNASYAWQKISLVFPGQYLFKRNLAYLGKTSSHFLPETTRTRVLPNVLSLSVVIDILITAIVFSLFWRLWGVTRLNSWAPFFFQTVSGYGDPWYFLTSAFLWLQGLFYFRLLCFTWHIPSAGGIGCLRDISAATHLRPVCLIYGISIAVFLLIQLSFHIPEGWARDGLQSPFEDISSFGSIAVSLFVFAVANQPRWSQRWCASNAFYCLLLLAMVGVSWSRGTWLACTVFLLVLVFLRVSRVCAFAFFLVIFAALVVVNSISNLPVWTDRPFRDRLVSLVRVENPINKDAGRHFLYKKAARMLEEHPILGHGIGSFYLKSVKYGQPDDPHSNTPDFAHNVFLQIAVEQGIPIALVFAGLVAWALSIGFRAWLEPQGNSKFRLTMLSITLTLGVYMQTQMTANSLNIYSSNQFFFWFITAAIFSLSNSKAGSVRE